MGDSTAILVHGAGVGPWIWDRVIEQTARSALALAVPGREPGATPDGCAARLAAEIDAAGIEEVVLVVHSLAGVLVPAMAERLGSRLRHVVYVSAVIPAAGTAFVNAIGFPAGLLLRVLFRFNRSGLVPSEKMIRRELGNDLSEQDASMVVERYEAEFPGFYVTPVSGPPSVPTTYVTLSHDKSLLPPLQASMVARLDSPHIVQIDSGHLVMLSQPAELAAVIDAAVASSAS